MFVSDRDSVHADRRPNRPKPLDNVFEAFLFVSESLS